MAACCPPGSWPALKAPADYSPKGKEMTIGNNLKVYVVGQPGPAAIVVFPEVFGWEGRLKGICDTYADHGFFAIMPDCHRGTTAATAGKDLVGWLNKYPFDPMIKQDIADMMACCKTSGCPDNTKFGAVGHCWGVWALCKAASEGVPFACGVGPHPSTGMEDMLKGKGAQLEMMKKVNMPVLLMPAGGDPKTLKPGGEIATLMESKGGETHAFPDMEHGWMSRGDLTDPKVARDCQAAMDHGLQFFIKHLKGGAKM